MNIIIPPLSKHIIKLRQSHQSQKVQCLSSCIHAIEVESTMKSELQQMRRWTQYEIERNGKCRSSPAKKQSKLALKPIPDNCFLLYTIIGCGVISFLVRSLLNDCYWRSSTLKTELRAQWKDHGLGWGVPVEVARPPPVLLHPRRGACSAGAADRRHSCLWGWHQQPGWKM